MYVVTNKNNEIVGYHADESVAFEYVLKYNKYSDKDEVDFHFIKDKKFKKYLKDHRGDKNKYLLRFNNTYVPEMFLDSEQLSDNGFIQEVKYARDTIDTLMSCYDNIDDKQLKQLMKSFRIISDIIIDAENYTADINILKYHKQHISELIDSDKLFRYNI